jgi:CelD/BcsL family acetyltransferase involved in cellulose biosynthesis
MHNNPNNINALTEEENIENSFNCLRIELVDTSAKLFELEADWNQLVATSASHVYQTHTWLSLWWKHYSNGTTDTLHTVLFYDNEELVGIAPFFIQTDSLLGYKFIRRLSLLGSGNSFNKSFGIFLDDGPSDYLDIIIKPDFEKIVCENLYNLLVTDSKFYDEIALLNVREDGNIYKNLMPIFQSNKLAINIYYADVCPYLSTPSSIDLYLNGLPQSVKRRLLQSWKAANEGSLFSIKNIENLDEYHTAIEDLIRIHQNRWNKIGYPGYFSSRNYRNFFSEVINVFHKNNWLWFKTAQDENQCVAGRLAFYFNNRYYDYLSGFDESSPAAKRRPGLALLIGMINDASKKGILVTDFLRGNESYKFDFTDTVVHNYNVRIKLNRSANPVLSISSFLLQIISFLKLLIGREIELVKLQYSSKTFPAYIIDYIVFRAPLFLKKIKNISTKYFSFKH